MLEASASTKLLNDRAMQIVNVALDRLGGIGEIVKQRKTDMMPALMTSAYILVLSIEERRSPEEIAEILDLTPGAVRSVLEAPTEGAEERLRYIVDEAHEFDRHTDPEWTDMPPAGRLEPAYLTGAVAKSAYTLIRRQEGTIKSWPG